MSPHDPDDLILIRELRNEIAELLADAMRLAGTTQDETDRVAAATAAETARVAAETEAETERVARAHETAIASMELDHQEQLTHLEKAIDTRDLIGQAKGIIMVTMRCTPETAFEMLKNQSQHENRKLFEIAAEIVANASRRVVPRPNSAP